MATWDVPTQHAALSGDLCGDGSGMNVTVAEFRRCGWAVCQVMHQGDGYGTVVASIHGALPGFEQEVPRAELYGLYKALTLGLAPIHYHTDCKFVSDGFCAGPAGTTRGCHMFADLWRLVWAAVEDIGLIGADGVPQVRVSWIKGHSSRKAVAEGKIKEWQRTGNFHADRYAKIGASLHNSFTALITKHDRAVRSCMYLSRFIGRISVRVHKSFPDAAPDRRAQACAGRRPARTPKEAVRHLHQTSTSGKLIVCWKCGQASSNLTLLGKRPCKSIEDAKHVLWRIGDELYFCTRCGSRSSKRVRLLKDPCLGAPKSSTTSRTLRDLKRGILPGKRWGGMPVPSEVTRPSAPDDSSAVDAVPGQVRVRAGGQHELASTFDLALAMFQPGFIGERDLDPLTTPLVWDVG